MQEFGDKSTTNLNHVASRRVNIEFVKPRVEFLEGLSPGDIVDENGAMGTSIEVGSQRSKSFGARRVPNGQLHFVGVDGHRGGLKVHSNRGGRVILEGVIREP